MLWYKYRARYVYCPHTPLGTSSRNVSIPCLYSTLVIPHSHPLQNNVTKSGDSIRLVLASISALQDPGPRPKSSPNSEIQPDNARRTKHPPPQLTRRSIIALSVRGSSALPYKKKTYLSGEQNGTGGHWNCNCDCDCSHKCSPLL